MTDHARRASAALAAIAGLCLSWPAAAGAGVAAVPAKLLIRGDGGVFKLKEDVSVPADKTVHGSVVVIDGDARIEGRVTEDVVVLGGGASVAGSVDGDVVILGTRSSLGPHSKVGGDFVSLCTKVERDPAATVSGQTVVLHGLGILVKVLSLGGLAALAVMAFRLVSIAGWLLLASITGAFLNNPLRRTSELITSRPLTVAFLGVAFWPALTLVLAALVVSIMGLPLVPVVGVAMALACVWGYLAAGELLGEMMLRPAAGLSETHWLPCLVGIAVLQLSTWIPVVGKALNLVAIVAGVGASLLRAAHAVSGEL